MATYKFNSAVLSDYFYDSTTGFVYSTKRPGIPYQMTWSHRYDQWGDATGEPYVTLSTIHGPQRLTKSAVIRTTKDMPDTTTAKVIPAPEKSNSKYRIISDIDDEPYSFGTVYNDLNSAKADAEVLAGENHASEYTVVQIIGTVKASGVTWA